MGVWAEWLAAHAARLQVAKEEAEREKQLKASFLNFGTIKRCVRNQHPVTISVRRTVCHEIRNPLHAITGLGGLSLDDPKITSAELKENIQSMLQSAQLMTAIADEILDLSKLEQRRTGLQHILFDISDLVETVIDSYRAICARKQIALLTSIRCDVRMFIGDPYRFHQILSILLGNAIKVSGLYSLKWKVLF